MDWPVSQINLSSLLFLATVLPSSLAAANSLLDPAAKNVIFVLFTYSVNKLCVVLVIEKYHGCVVLSSCA